MADPVYQGPPPVARSPLGAACTVRGGDELALGDRSLLGKVLVHAPDGAGAVLGTRTGRAVRTSTLLDGEALVAGAGPGEWFVVVGEGEAAKAVLRLCERLAGANGGAGSAGGDAAAGAAGSAVDVTHGRVLLRLSGARAVDVLAHLCPVDLSDPLVPDGGALRSLVAGIAVDLVRDDAGSERPGAPSYLLHADRSYGRHLWASLVDAGAEYGLVPAS